jgi:hypothetical protein
MKSFAIHRLSRLLDRPPSRTMTVAPGTVPLWLKLAYSAFMAVMLPVYLHYYGPTNFLYFCDLALLLTLIGIWIDSPLLISMCAVGIIAPQALWVVDFLVNLAGVPFTGMTDYMFKHDNSLFLRALSLFHGWLPFLLAYLVWRIGYDRRGLPAWTVLTWVVLPICFFLMPPPDPNAGLTPVNINLIWGPDDAAAQTWVGHYVWFAGMMIGLPVLLYWPVHLLLARTAPRPA